MTRSIYTLGPALPAGEARCPGPTPADIIARDGDTPPDALLAERYEFLGDDDLPFERYTDPGFFEREMTHMWSRTWQWACREEQIPKAGDFYVYEVGHFSVLVVRGDDRIRAFVNSCPHRGMQFEGAGACGSGKQFIRCPFHGMSWHLDGSLREIPCRWDFPHIDDATFTLMELPCEIWGGFVFINLDRDALPLETYLEVLPEHFETWDLGARYISMHTEKVLPGNWKMCMEGFLEAYHVIATHPEGLRTSGWANTQYDIFSPHVTRFLQTLSSGNPHYEKELTETELFASLGHAAEALPDGKTARQAHADIVRLRMGERLDVDLSGVSNSELLDSIEYHVFPNACFFPGITIPLIYRFRPLGVDRTIHDIMMLSPLPASGERPAPTETIRLGEDDSYTSVAALGGLGHVLDQDTDNFKRQWAGIRASIKGRQTLGNYQEARIRHFHQTLDGYLQG